ncbi:hypothetical protein KR52_12825 [Synechococcus sp. KORDI-52]|nr:hypothetical protein KR52_12825 [Synechococcus sp. KORDI-52]
MHTKLGNEDLDFRVDNDKGSLWHEQFSKCQIYSSWMRPHLLLTTRRKEL